MQPTLAGNVSEFLASHSHLVPSDANGGFVWRDIAKAMRGEAGADEWTRHTFYVRPLLPRYKRSKGVISLTRLEQFRDITPERMG